MLYYMNIFTIYAILGYILETILKTLVFHNLDNHTMYGPWIPLYGFGVCIIISLMRLVFNRFKLNKIKKIFSFFIISTISLTILELLGGYIMEFLTGKIMWDYSFLKFHIGHYIALEVSLLWGIISLIIVYFINPLMNEVIKHIPKIITYLFIIIILTDIIISTLNPHV